MMARTSSDCCWFEDEEETRLRSSSSRGAQRAGPGNSKAAEPLVLPRTEPIDDDDISAITRCRIERSYVMASSGRWCQERKEKAWSGKKAFFFKIFHKRLKIHFRVP